MMAKDPHRYYQWWKEMHRQLVPLGSGLWKMPVAECRQCEKELTAHLYWCPKCWPHPEFCTDCFDDHVEKEHGVEIP